MKQDIKNNIKNNIKNKVRHSKEWLEHRKHIASLFDNTDPITNKKLLKGYNVHHLDLNPEHYDNLDENRFIPLNKLTHKTLHFLYRYWKKDKSILKRFEHWMKTMEEYEAN